MLNTLLKVEELKKEFGGVAAVNDVSFNVEKGERIGIIGPNGAGKTTLFNLINGLLSPSKGKIFFMGEDITKYPVYKRANMGISRSFQITSLFMNLTVKENVLIGFNGHKNKKYNFFKLVKKNKELMSDVNALINSIGLWKKRNEKVINLSYGEQRKLEIAISIFLRPKLLMLDEPNCGLTSEENANIIEMIESLDKEIAIIMVAHDIDLVFKFAKRIIVLHYGKIIAEGIPEEIRLNDKVREIYMGY